MQITAENLSTETNSTERSPLIAEADPSLSWAGREAVIQAALAANPGEPGALRDYGLLRKEQRRYPEAIWAFGKILSQAPADLDALWQSIECQLEAGDAVGARLFALRALNLAPAVPENASFFLSVANALFRVDDFCMAREAYKRVLRVQPGNAQAEEGVEKASARHQETLEALPLAPSPLLASVALLPDEPPEDVSQQPGQRYQVSLVNNSTSDGTFELSLDVYPHQRPSHPSRHVGYWNLSVRIRSGETVVVNVLWQPKTGKVWFNGHLTKATWTGEYKELGELTSHLIVYREQIRVNSCQFTRDAGESDLADKPRQVMIQLGNESPLRSAIWFLTWACNFKCPYCWEVQLINKGELKPDPFRDADKWVEAWNRLRPGTLDISGGEPFLQPNFIKMLQRFDDSIKVAITSNISFDLTEFVQTIAPSKVFSMTLSFHPTQKMPLNVFLGKAMLLKNRGFNVTVNFVTWPEQLWMLGNYKQIFESNGLNFHVDPYAPTPHYPFKLSEKEREYVRQFVGADRAHAGAITGEKKAIHVMCSGGVNHLNVQPNGDAYRCVLETRQNLPNMGTKVGNIFDPDFKLFGEWRPCAYYHICPSCDRDKVQVRRLPDPVVAKS